MLVLDDTSTSGRPLRTCTRARLSTDGMLYTCLFAAAGYDLRGLLRGAVRSVFDGLVPLEGMASVIDSFHQGWKVEIAADMPAGPPPTMRMSRSSVSRSATDRHHICPARCAVLWHREVV